MRNLLKAALLACGACFAAGALGTPALAAGYSEYSTTHGYWRPSAVALGA